MKSHYDHLYVLWRAPADGSRWVIGQLRRGADGSFAFGYERDLQAASSAGFALLSEFPEHRTDENPYRARHLFTSFAQRIPVPSRPDFPALIASWGVSDKDDSMEILALSGGVQTTDRIELSEYRASDDALDRPLVFRVAGGKHRPDPGVVKPGEALTLRRQPENPKDDRAVLVERRTGQELGFVPRQYSRMVSALLDAGTDIEAVTVRRLVLPEETGRWVVEIRRA